MRQAAHEVSRLQEQVADGVVLAFPPVQFRPDGRRGEVDIGGDDRPERPERVVTLGPRPLRKGRIGVERLQGGHIVHAGIAEDAVRGLCRFRILAGSADHDAELGLVDHPAVVRVGLSDIAARRQEGIRTFQEEQRVGRLFEPLFFRRRFRIVPQRHHLGRHAGRQQSRFGQGQGFAGGRRDTEHVAVEHGDGIADQRAEAGQARLPGPFKPNPVRHRYFSGRSAEYLARIRSSSSFEDRATAGNSPRLRNGMQASTTTREFRRSLSSS